jgi:MFS family permease
VARSHGNGTPRPGFFGPKVVWAAFTLAILGWGSGLYGPPVFLHAVIERTGWPLELVSAVVTAHFVFGALFITRLRSLYARFGLPAVTCAGSVILTIGIIGWALAREPWQLVLAAMCTGCGWVTMSGAAVNAIIAPWFIRKRPAALSTAYNGASIGGVIMTPLWATLILNLSFPVTAVFVGVVTISVVWILSVFVFSKSPESMGQFPDGEPQEAKVQSAVTSANVTELKGQALWQNKGFLTLCAGMTLGLFAQIGLLEQLYSVLVPTLGPRLSGYALGLATFCAIVGRTSVGRFMPLDADRRLVSCLSYAIQFIGSILMLFALDTSALLLLGIILYGLGIGNATSLPPLIAQKEFVSQDVQRVVPMILAVSQGTYAFAPGFFGFLRSLAPDGSGTMMMFAVAGAIQLLAIACFFAGRSTRSPR